MKLTALIFYLMMSTVIVYTVAAQELIQYPVPSLELKIKGEGGRNGASVTYNPDKQFYYAVMAGNAQYPLETFSRTGKNIYEANAYSDMRGLWWNPKTKELEGNCYADGGIVSIGLTEEGFAGSGNKQIFYGGYSQPNEQAVGSFDPKKKEILYYSEGTLVGYSRKNGNMTSTFVWLYNYASIENINWTTAIFTGVAGMEIGILDYVDKKVYLFNRKDGSLTGTVNLPANVVTYEAFNFSYANGFIFLFDQDARKWTGYRIFEF